VTARKEGGCESGTRATAAGAGLLLGRGMAPQQVGQAEGLISHPSHPEHCGHARKAGKRQKIKRMNNTSHLEH
jgi:hypothetical protein